MKQPGYAGLFAFRAMQRAEFPTLRMPHAHLSRCGSAA